MNRAQRRALKSKKKSTQTRVNPRTQPLQHKKTKFENKQPSLKEMQDQVEQMSDLEVAEALQNLNEKRLNEQK